MLWKCYCQLFPPRMKSKVETRSWAKWEASAFWLLLPKAGSFCNTDLEHVHLIISSKKAGHGSMSDSFCYYQDVVCACPVAAVMSDSLRPNVAHQAALPMGLSRQQYWGLVAMPSSRRSSWPRNWAHISYVSYIAGGFYTHWDTWEAHQDVIEILKWMFLCLLYMLKTISSNFKWLF